MSETDCETCSTGIEIETDTCPECGSPKYELTEGCGKCRACGYSGCTV